METPRIEDAPESVSEELTDPVADESSEATSVDPDGMALRAGEAGPDFLALDESGDVIEPEVVATIETPPAAKAPLPSDSPWTESNPVSTDASDFSWNPGAPASVDPSAVESESEIGDPPLRNDEDRDVAAEVVGGEEPEIAKKEVKGALEAFFQADPSFLADSPSSSEEVADHGESEDEVIGKSPELGDEEAAPEAEVSSADAPSFAWMSAGMSEADADSKLDADSEIGLMEDSSPWSSEEEVTPASVSEEAAPETAPADGVVSLIDIACPECGKGLSLKREHLGIAGHCVWCEAPIVASESVTEQLVRIFLLKPGSGATAVSIPVSEAPVPVDRDGEGDAEAEVEADLETEIDLKTGNILADAEAVVPSEVSPSFEIESESLNDNEPAAEGPMTMADSDSSEKKDSGSASAWTSGTSWTPPSQESSFGAEATEPGIDPASTTIKEGETVAETELSQDSTVGQGVNFPETKEDEAGADLGNENSGFSWMPPEVGAESESGPEAEGAPEPKPELEPALGPKDEEKSETESEADPFATAARITGSDEPEGWTSPDEIADEIADEEPEKSTISTGTLPSSFSLGAESPVSLSPLSEGAETKNENEGGSEGIDSLSSLIERSQTGGSSGGLFAAPLNTGGGADNQGSLDVDDLLIEPDEQDSEVVGASEPESSLSEVPEEEPDESTEVGSAAIQKSLFESSVTEEAAGITGKKSFEDEATAEVSDKGDEVTETAASDSEIDADLETEEALVSSTETPPKKKRKSRVVTLVILLLMVLGLAAGGAAAFLFREQIQASLLSRFGSPPPELVGAEAETPDMAPEPSPSGGNEGAPSEEPISPPVSVQSSETLDSSAPKAAGDTPSSDDLPTSIAPSRPEPQLIPENRSLFGGGSLQINDGSEDPESSE